LEFDSLPYRIPNEGRSDKPDAAVPMRDHPDDDECVWYTGSMFTASFRRFLTYALPYWHLCLGSIVCGVVKFSLALLLPGALGLVVKYVVEADSSVEERTARLAGIIGLLVGAFLLRAPITFCRTYLAELAGNRTIFDIRTDLYRHIQRLSLRYHSNQRTGATISRLIGDINAAQGILDKGVISVTVDFLFLLGVVALLVVLDWRLAMASLLTLPLYGLAIIYLNPRIRRASEEVQQQVSEMSAEATEKLSGLSIVLAFVREKTEELSFFQSHRAYLGRVMGKTRVQATQFAATEFLTAAGPLVVIAYGGYRAITGTLDLSHFVWFYGFINHLYLPTRRLADCSAIVQERLAAVDRVFALFDEEPDVADRPGAKYMPRPDGRIEFRHVYFGYAPETPVLHDMTFCIEPGESVAIVGKSGAGKSTLVNLVPRFWDVNLGEITIDGRNIAEVQLKSLRSHIGMVLQDTILFSGTIRENILYGNGRASDADMIHAAQMAHVDEFVDELPDGYDTVIGERGVKLSGGQKQRLSIARAFLRDPRILILDEATSNLDSHAENIIQEALTTLMKGRTTLVIAHRLSTVVGCDRVLVVEEGRIVQEGSHDELIQVTGPYRTLCEEQFGYVRLDSLGNAPLSG
jgi:ATP-binding cassette, subfamily B, putative efflux pump